MSLSYHRRVKIYDEPVNDPSRSAFNPMSQSFVNDVNEIHRMTLDPEIKGSTYHPHSGRLLPVYYPPDRSSGNPDVWVVGGAPNPETGARFPTHSVLSHQFSPRDVESNIMRTALSAHSSGDTTLSAGTWHVPKDPEDPTSGRVDLDVSDIHPEEKGAMKVATQRGEEAIFGNQGAVEKFTIHSPRHPDYQKK